MKLEATRMRPLLILMILLVGGAAVYFPLAKLGFFMPLTEILSVVCFPSCPPEQPFHPPVESKNLLNYEKPLQQILSNPQNQEEVTILIEKSKFRLTIFQKLQPLKSYPVVFGSSPEGDKLHEGDRKTPEGIYYVRDLYPHSSWSKFIWLDYPRPESWRSHFQAKFSGRINWHLPIGGQIGIHGVPAGQDSMIEQRVNWTWGCIALTNQDVDEVYSVIDSGTLVEIVP